MKYPDEDVALSNGHGFFVERYKFDKYIDAAPHSKAEVWNDTNLTTIWLVTNPRSAEINMS